MKFLVSAIVFLFVYSNAFADNLRGKWDGEDYSISISESFDYIRGSWGTIDFDLSVSESFQYIRGDFGDREIDVRFSQSFSYVRGTLPCGDVDYSYSLSFNYVRGVVCNQEFRINLESKDDVIPTAKHIFLDELLSGFPRPTKRIIRRFILSRINL